MKLRAKVLLSLVFVVGALTCSTLLVLRHTVQAQVQNSLTRDLRNSAQTLAKFQRDREYTLARVAEFTAADPGLRAAITSNDPKTVQDASPDLITLTRSCFVLISDRHGRVMAVQTQDSPVSRADIEKWLSQTSLQGRQQQWWYSSGELFQVFSEPVYFGQPSPSHLLGFLTLGYGINDSVVHRVSEISDSQVIFFYGDQAAGTTVAQSTLRSCHGCFLSNPKTESASSVNDLYLNGEHYLYTSVALADAPASVRLLVLRSLDAANKTLASVNRTLVGLGMTSIVVGCLIIFAISRHFARPLEDLLGGVRALAHRDFQYPLQVRSHGEFAELTSAFESMRASLVNAQRDLLQAEQLATIGRTAGSLSHDLRHRLTAVLANSEFLLDEPNPQRREALYAGIRNAVTHMTELLDALVEFARSPHSKQCVLVDLRSVLEDSIAALRFHPQFHNIAIDLVIPEEIEAWLDSKRLRRAVYNLLFNSCEVVSPTRGVILVAASRIGHRVEIRITDNGPGIPDEVRASLFKPFVTHGKQNGTGLGLAIVQKCCRDHGGDVELLESRPGRTTFKIILPLADFESEDRVRDDDSKILAEEERPLGTASI